MLTEDRRQEILRLARTWPYGVQCEDLILELMEEALDSDSVEFADQLITLGKELRIEATDKVVHGTISHGRAWFAGQLEAIGGMLKLKLLRNLETSRR